MRVSDEETAAQTLDRGGARPCPADGTALSPRGGDDVHGCGRCGGLWFPGETVRRIGQAYPSAVAAGSVQLSGVAGDRPCCDCDAGPLRIVHLHGVEVDRCEACGGLWFDAGEVDLVRRRSSPRPLRSRDGDDSRRRDEMTRWSIGEVAAELLAIVADIATGT